MTIQLLYFQQDLQGPVRIVLKTYSTGIHHLVVWFQNVSTKGRLRSYCHFLLYTWAAHSNSLGFVEHHPNKLVKGSKILHLRHYHQVTVYQRHQRSSQMTSNGQISTGTLPFHQRRLCPSRIQKLRKTSLTEALSVELSTICKHVCTLEHYLALSGCPSWDLFSRRGPVVKGETFIASCAINLCKTRNSSETWN